MSNSELIFKMSISAVDCKSLIDIITKFQDNMSNFPESTMRNMEIFNKDDYKMKKSSNKEIADHLRKVYEIMKINNDSEINTINKLYRYYNVRSNQFMFYPINDIIDNYSSNPIKCKLNLFIDGKLQGKFNNIDGEIYGIDRNCHLAIKFIFKCNDDELTSYLYIHPGENMVIDDKLENNNDNNIEYEISTLETEMESNVPNYNISGGYQQYMDISENKPDVIQNLSINQINMQGGGPAEQEKVEKKLESLLSQNLESLLSQNPESSNNDIPYIC